MKEPISDVEATEANRRFVLDEIIATERAFIYSVDIILNGVRQTVLKRKVLRREERDAFEYSLQPLWAINSVHRRFLECLISHRESKTASAKIAQHLLPQIEELRQPHKAQTEQLHAALFTLEQLKLGNVKFSDELLKMVDHIDVWPLEVMLARPIKRLTQYHLLFNKLLEFTPEDHEDYPHTRDALELILSIVKQMDEIEGKLEPIYRLKMYEREMCFQNALTTDGKKKKVSKFSLHLYKEDGSRRVIAESDFKQVLENKYHLPGSDTPKFIVANEALRMFLTNDLLMLARQASKSKKQWNMLHEPIPLCDVDVIEMPAVRGVLNNWMMLKVGSGELYYLTCTLEQQRTWVESIKRCKTELTRDSNAMQQQESQVVRRNSFVNRLFKPFRRSKSRTSITESEKTSTQDSVGVSRASTPMSEDVPASDKLEVECKAYVFNKISNKWVQLGEAVIYGYPSLTMTHRANLTLYQLPLTGRPLYQTPINDALVPIVTRITEKTPATMNVMFNAYPSVDNHDGNPNEPRSILLRFKDLSFGQRLLDFIEYQKSRLVPEQPAEDADPLLSPVESSSTDSGNATDVESLGEVSEQVVHDFLKQTFADALDRAFNKPEITTYQEEDSTPILPRRTSSIALSKKEDGVKFAVNRFLDDTLEAVIAKLEHSHVHESTREVNEEERVASERMKIDLKDLISSWHALLITKASDEEERRARNREFSLAISRLNELLSLE